MKVGLMMLLAGSAVGMYDRLKGFVRVFADIQNK